MTATPKLPGYNAAVEAFRDAEYPMLRGML